MEFKEALENDEIHVAVSGVAPPSSLRIATVFSAALGTKELTSTYSGSFEPSALRSEQWSLSPQGPSPSSVGTASQIKLPSLKPPRSSTLTGMPSSLPASCQTAARRSVSGLRGHGGLSVRISTFTQQA